MREVVPADENCFFTSSNALMNNGILDLSCSKVMREIIASVFMSDPINVSLMFLRCFWETNNSYCHWIMKPDSWGGAIEFSILSQYFNDEMVVVDTQGCRRGYILQRKNFCDIRWHSL